MELIRTLAKVALGALGCFLWLLLIALATQNDQLSTEIFAMFATL